MVYRRFADVLVTAGTIVTVKLPYLKVYFDIDYKQAFEVPSPMIWDTGFISVVQMSEW